MAGELSKLVKKNQKYLRDATDLNEQIDRFLLQEQLAPFKGTLTFHPSLVSKGIECQIWWFYYFKEAAGKDEAWSDESLTAMMIGKGIHNQFQETLYRMGLLEGVWKCMSCEFEFWATAPKGKCANCGREFKSWNYLKFKEVPLSFGLVKGHADGFINQEGTRTLLEIKSIKNVSHAAATYGYEKLVNNPLDDHFIQTQLYLHNWAGITNLAAKGELQDSPIMDGAKVIGPIDNGIINYLAKNSSEKKSFLVKRNQNSVQFLLDSMKIIWQAFLDNAPKTLTGVDINSKSICKKCAYRGICDVR